MVKSRFLYLLLMAVLSGILLGLSWPPNQLTFVIFFAFLPLLFIVDELNKDGVKHSNFKLFLLSLTTFLVWNFLSLWWISKATLVGGIAEIIGNSILMTIPILLYHQIKKHISSKASYIALITFWISYEYIQFNWDLAWPWINLGNIFAIRPGWIQWYEYTGVLGGTLWILLINVAIYSLVTYLFRFNKGVISSIKLYNRLGFFLFTLIVPFTFSFIITPDKGTELHQNAVIVQPNIDPYHEKFQNGLFEEQIKKLVHLSDSLADSNTSMIVWPETAISASMDENNINDQPAILYIRDFLKKHPGAKIVSGMDSYRFFEKNEKITATARKYEDLFYDAYNSAIVLDTSRKFEIYHKSKLVPGVEKMPYPQVFSFLGKLAIDLGGTSGSLGIQKEASVFRINDSVITAPVICYESVFGDYLGDYVQKGANVITIMTNDGWWGNTKGYRQHYFYATLRAIELRRFIIRSANTGISCFIEPSGRILNPTSFWVPATLKQNIQINNRITFYARNGDYIGKIGAFTAILFILIWIPGLISEKRRSKKR
jgi:apolipoprotein N-acyltransferase